MAVTIRGFLGCSNIQCGGWIQMFRRTVLPPYSGLKFSPEDGGWHPTYNTARQSRKPRVRASPPWKPEISHTDSWFYTNYSIWGATFLTHTDMQMFLALKFALANTRQVVIAL